MKINGKVTHCETVPLAGSKKATRGNAGRELFVIASWRRVPLPAPSALTADFGRFRGACDDFEEAMFYRISSISCSH